MAAPADTGESPGQENLWEMALVQAFVHSSLLHVMRVRLEQHR